MHNSNIQCLILTKDMFISIFLLLIKISIYSPDPERQSAQLYFRQTDSTEENVDPYCFRYWKTSVLQN